MLKRCSFHRRSVSTLLDSAFRENLDRLIRSYVERQGRGPLSLHLEGTHAVAALDSPVLQGQEQQHGDDEEEQELRDATNVRPRLAIPPPPMPPRQPLWHSELHHNNWIRQNIHRSDIVSISLTAPSFSTFYFLVLLFFALVWTVSY
jgi:hypothetical protein